MLQIAPIVGVDIEAAAEYILANARTKCWDFWKANQRKREYTKVASLIKEPQQISIRKKPEGVLREITQTKQNN